MIFPKPQILTCVCVYNRVENIPKWERIWEKSKHYGSGFHIIHNRDDVKTFIPRSSFIIDRQNRGADIGAFIDMKHFDWEKIVWFADDYIPLTPNFLEPFITQLTGRVGMVGACYEPANECNKHGHVRTVGFSMIREVFDRITENLVVNNRQDCFEFEHGPNNMTNRVLETHEIRMAIGKNYPEAGYSHWPNNCENFMWDSGLLAGYKLWPKFEEVFGA